MIKIVIIIRENGPSNIHDTMNVLTPGLTTYKIVFYSILLSLCDVLFHR